MERLEGWVGHFHALHSGVGHLISVYMSMGTTQPTKKNSIYPIANTKNIYWLLRNCTFWRITPLQCSWMVREHFEPGISFITCSNNMWKPFFALLKNCYAWTIAVFTTNPSYIYSKVKPNFTTDLYPIYSIKAESKILETARVSQYT